MKTFRWFSAFVLVASLCSAVVASSPQPAGAAEVSGWVQQSPAHSPGNRYDAALAHDGDRSTTLLFGGFVDNSRMGDTWIWDGSDWSERNAVVHPSPRNAAVIGYDGDRDQMILFGGSGNNGLLSDTWRWDGTTWELLITEHAPSARFGAAMTYDTVRGELVLFGGNDGSPRNDTWAWSGTDWVERQPTNAPSPRYYHSMAFDEAHGTTLLFGGAGYNTNYCYYYCYWRASEFGDTWSWDGAEWHQHAPQTFPETRLGPSMVFDPVSGRLMFFGGLHFTCVPYNCYEAFPSDTWTWTGSNWLQLSLVPEIPGRAHASTVFDEANQHVLVLGGRSPYGRNDTWILGHQQAISFGALSDRGIADGAFGVSATADSGLPVTFSSDTTSTCTVSGSTVTPVDFGTCTIRASQAGSGIYSAASDVVRSFTITRSAQTITFADPGERHIDETSFEVAPTASSGLPVTVSVDPGSSCSISGSTVTILGVGTCTVRAAQAGDTYFEPATDVVREVAITKVPQTIDFPVIPGHWVGEDPGSFAISATASSGLTVGLASETSGTCTVSGTTLTIVASGTCRVRATQAGDGYYAAAPDVVHAFSIAPFGGASAGSFGSCAPRSDGGASCWGRDLAVPSQSSTSPTDVPGLEAYRASLPGNPVVREVAEGVSHACALLDGGRVVCWGRNSLGQLGIGTRTAVSGVVAPIGLTDVRAISAGGNHTCALLGSGRVKCWGSNGNGELGYGSRATTYAPVTVRDLEGARGVSAGRANTCATLESGGVRCWGNNAYGQLGDGTNTASSLPVAVAGIDDAVATSIGGFHACAVRSGGGVVCWGRNNLGQLGTGNKVSSRTAVPVVGVAGATTVSAGSAHTCVTLANGHLLCWGANTSAQLGDGTRYSSTIASEVAGATGMVSVSAGVAHTCARAEDRTVWCWGLGSFGRLGTGSTANSVVPLEVGGL